MSGPRTSAPFGCYAVVATQTIPIASRPLAHPFKKGALLMNELPLPPTL